jgi:hypothetical protein
MNRTKTVLLAVTTVALLIFGTGSVLAGPVIPIISNVGDTITFSPLGAVSAVAVNPHPLWEPNSNHLASGAVWISYAQTGYQGNTLAPPSGTTVVMTVVESFYANAGSVLSLKVWTDDTSEVFINGVSVFPPNFTQNICANGPIGCQPQEPGIINYVFQTSGWQTITFNSYQVGTGTDTTSNPFGLLYDGTVTLVPEPGSLLLLGLGLMGVAGFRRK